MLLNELVKMIGATVHEHSASMDGIEIAQVAPLHAAKIGQITFLTKPELSKELAHTKASAVLIAKAVEDCTAIQIIHPNPYLAFARVAQILNPPKRFPVGVHPKAHVEESAVLGKDVSVRPFAYVGSRVVVGDRVQIHPGAVIEDDCKIGDDCVIHANAVIESRCELGKSVIVHSNAVIGADGFGFAPGQGEIQKIPQIGIVCLEDDVEIGACTTIDRAAMEVTRVGAHSKLDSHVHIGHNVVIGHHTMISGMVGVAGSAKIGNWVMIAGHAGINGHVSVGDRCVIGGMTGVTSNIDEPGMYIGYPPLPANEWKRQSVYLKRLPDYDRRIKELERKLV